MKQGKMHYLNFRTLCAWSFMVLFLAALLGYLIYEKIRGNGAGWFPVIFGGCLLVLGICYAVVEIWLPYRRIEKRIELFLDGYTTSNLVGEDGIHISPELESLVSKMQYLMQSQEMLNLNKRQAQYLALQNQINPHFLFNVLESIRMHSILKKENETADMVAKLAVMQRQYVEWGNDSVSIFQEIEFVKAYLALQKYRFGERLNYDIEVDRECENFKIPKLTIVTFVENACVHGIESKSSPGWIFVRIGRQGERLEIEIEDTGSGMAEAKLTELQNNMCNADIEMLKGGGRVGIINACVRLKMVTENRVEFRVEGEEGVGTTVTIRIPCLQEGKTDAESIAGR